MYSSQNARKRKSDEMGPSTPTGSPLKKMKITQSQKQTLIDNLQLEITERARQLRAQYALQCSDLRSRIERRIHRVPVAMRKMKMGELLAQHEQAQSKSDPPAPQPIAQSPPKQQLDERRLPALPSPTKLPSPTRKPILQSPKSRKRKSSAINIPSDKENHEPDVSGTGPDSLPVQKNAKRAKTAAPAAPQPPKRNGSRTQKKALKANENPSGVLSPRSHNSKTLPKSPMKDKELPPLAADGEISPLRHPSPPRPTSPPKPQSPLKAAVSGATSALSAFAKRGYAAAGAAGARLTRPLSREKEQNTLTGLGSTIPASSTPTGKMLPPPRPALATLTSTVATASTTSIPTLSPQRAVSQASIRSQSSEQSSTSTNGTVVTKPTRAVGAKKLGLVSKAAGGKKTAAASSAASRTKGKVAVSGSTTGTVSPKAGGAAARRPPTAMAKRAAATSTTAASKKAVTTGGPSATGRVLRKRN